VFGGFSDGMSQRPL